MAQLGRDDDERAEIWHRDACASSPTRCSRSASSTRRCSRCVVVDKLRNMPETGLYGFDPTCYFGVYMPDTFWLDRRA